MFRLFNAVLVRIGQIWCAATHREPMWPINGHYICRRCQREFPVMWEDKRLPAPRRESPALARLSPLMK